MENKIETVDDFLDRAGRGDPTKMNSRKMRIHSECYEPIGSFKLRLNRFVFGAVKVNQSEFVKQ